MYNVLLVDDSAVMRKIIQRNINEIMAVDSFLEAGDGMQALDVVKEHADSISLILCDWNMPNMTGIEFLQTLKSLNLQKEIPIVMVTTESSDDKISEAKGSGADGYLTKPFTPDQLRETLGPYLLVK